MEKDNFKHSAVDEHSKDKDAISLPTHGSSAEICQINTDSTNTAQEKVTKPCMKTTSKAKGKRRYKYW